ncbi:hypothetical protein ACHAWU_003851 [Discostella pseudostelligera]|uniref:Uncharacterized protein n=1 Tax=Discostella pseudostelligera TaxID=259834 RepID=A0ABD3ME42_9STRA
MKSIKRKRTNSTVPQKGDPGYLTPTQLRNLRKRRAKKQGSSSSTVATSDAATATAGDATASNSKKKYNMKDPSMKYITDPLKAPVVQAAKNFFKSILQNCTIPTFRVHVGALDGWRTVSKLAVRASTPSSANNAKPKVAIGLFLPQSHTLLTVPNCRAHHPSINRAVECIEKACHDVGVVPYQETVVTDNREAKSSAGDSANNSSNAGVDHAILSKKDSESGVGQLRYVAINVARESGAVQITLVWNTPPPRTLSSKQTQQFGGGSESIDDPVLQKLVTKLIDMSSVETKNNPSKDVDREENDSGVATSTDANIDTTCSSDPPPKKRRRRGRHEGKTSVKNDVSNNNKQEEYTLPKSNSNNLSNVSQSSNETKQRNQ